MVPQALILSRDEKIASAFRRTFDSAGISSQTSSFVGETLKLLSKNKYDAVVVNCADFKDGFDALLALRTGRSNKSSIAIAITSGAAAAKTAYSAGANFVLQGPVSIDCIEKTFRVAHGLVLRERHRYLRHALNVPIYLASDGASDEQLGRLLNLSEGGMAIGLDATRHIEGNVRFRFILPDSTTMICGNGNVVWKAAPQIGMRINQLELSARRKIDSWLKHMRVPA